MEPLYTRYIQETFGPDGQDGLALPIRRQL